MKKKLLLLCILLFSLKSFTQSKASTNIFLDPKMAMVKDEHGNKPFTLNFLTGFSLELKQRNAGYFFFGQTLEYADLYDGNYLRYSIIQIGYTFNNIPYLKNTELSFSANYGITRRWSNWYTNYGVNSGISYKISDSLKVTSLLQLVRRTDLETIHTGAIFRASFFFGVRFDITRLYNI